MQRIVLVGRNGRINRLLVEAFEQVERIKEFHDVVSGDVCIPISYSELKEIAEKLKQAKQQAQPSCFFVMPKHHRMNEHPNDDWRGQGNRKKRIKRNDR